jgi:hypothetical protein
MTCEGAYPGTPGHRFMDTSMAAAASIAKVTGSMQRMVYHAICEVGARGLTSDELADRLRIDRGTLQPRTSELKLLGLIRDGGQRRQWQEHDRMDRHGGPA